VSGPNGFVAIGIGGLWLDTDAILADFAPEASTAHYMVGHGPSTIEISTEDGTEIELTYAELGVTPEQRDELLAAASSVHLSWSADGTSWMPIDPTEVRAHTGDTGGEPEEVSRIEGLVASDDAFYLFAGTRVGFRSTDGRNWTSFEMDGLPAELDFGVSAVNGGFVLFGGEESHGYFSGGPGGEQSIWTSADGRVWTRGSLGVPPELGEDLEFDVYEAAGGPPGILVHGITVPFVERIESVTVAKHGSVVAVGTDSWTLIDEATGELIAEVDMETMAGGGIVVEEDEGTLSFTDSATGEVLIVVTRDDIRAAENAALAAAGEIQPIVSKDGFAVTLGLGGWVVADEATGEVITTLEMESAHMELDETGEVVITDPATGDDLLVLTRSEVEAVEQAAFEAAEPEPVEPEMDPAELLAFSTDGATWTVDETTALFGETATILRVAVGTDCAIALVVTDPDALMKYALEGGEPPPTEVWVGEASE
jgi:hypothetical protein